MTIVSGTFEIVVATVVVTGRLDALEARSLRTSLQDHIADGKNRIAVDLSEVTFVDSAGLAALVKGMKDARQGGGDLRLVTPASPDANRVFQLTRFDKVFTFGETIEAVLGTW
jgi:anti-anti-sigma factor